MIWKLFKLMPTPEAAVSADVAAVREIIEPLGLAPKRAPMLIRFSKEYLEKEVGAFQGKIARSQCLHFAVFRSCSHAFGLTCPTLAKFCSRFQASVCKLTSGLPTSLSLCTCPILVCALEST